MARPEKPTKFTTELISSADSTGWHFIAVTGEVGRKFESDGKSRRVVCTLNGKERFQCALMPSRGDFVILVNKKIRTSLGVAAGNVLKVTLEKDTSKYGLEMPEEFEEVLNQDPEGDKLFHALTPGKQRSLIYAVSSVKDVDKRIHRALIMIEHLKDNEGKIDNKKLYYELQRPLM
jgi:hypothetical protein